MLMPLETSAASTNAPATSPSPSSSSNSAVIGIVVGVVLGAIVLALVIFAIKRARMKLINTANTLVGKTSQPYKGIIMNEIHSPPSTTYSGIPDNPQAQAPVPAPDITNIVTDPK